MRTSTFQVVADGNRDLKRDYGMSYNSRLEDLIDHYFIDNEDLVKKKQMGGVGYLVNGNMCVGIYEDLLVVRTGPKLADTLAKRPGIKRFRQNEEELDGFISVDPEIYKHDKARHKFLSHALEHTSKLPPKEHEDDGAPGLEPPQ